MTSSPESSAAVSAIVTAFRRVEQTLDTLRRLEACRPAPDEIIVHVDGNEVACADAIRAVFPHLKVLVSDTSVGPGGGRNKLMAAARNELVASFDDDSYPIDADYFARVADVAGSFPDTAVFAASIFHRNETPPADESRVAETASFICCAAVFRKSKFIAAGGFVPLVVAYGMEEEDLALRLLDAGQSLLQVRCLRVFHDTDLSHHTSAAITAGTIQNLALLAWLRYPPRYWPYGVLQVANRVQWCVRIGRRAGILTGLLAIPKHLARHRRLRRPVSLAAMRRRFAVREMSTRPFAPNASPPAPAVAVDLPGGPR